MNRRRYVAAWFAVVTGPAYSRCSAADCGALLFGSRCWTWLEHGQRKYGCRLCGFKHARIANDARAAA
ncbi:MAG TPA: hypothetical protein VHM19_23100 [Polyangiales bacterium]|jgi:hypothetical protein|nr:hypothetical protein [Polyangiales bacterium]